MHGTPDQPGPEYDHRNGIDDAGRQKADIERIADIRLAHEFHRAAEDPIEDEEQAEGQAGALERMKFVRGEPQDKEQHDAFERRLIELARMARGTSVTRP